MLTVRLEPEIEARLNELAEATGRSKSHYVRQAIEEFLDWRSTASGHNLRVVQLRLRG